MKWTRSNNPYENAQRYKLIIGLSWAAIIVLFCSLCVLACHGCSEPPKTRARHTEPLPIAPTEPGTGIVSWGQDPWPPAVHTQMLQESARREKLRKE